MQIQVVYRHFKNSTHQQKVWMQMIGDGCSARHDQKTKRVTGGDGFVSDDITVSVRTRLDVMNGASTTTTLHELSSQHTSRQ